jgi:inner membrane transporter RhtA
MDRSVVATTPRLGSAPTGTAGAVLLVIGSMTALQFGAAAATHLFPEVGPAGASALRLGLSALILVVIGRPDPRRWTRAERRSVVLLGVTMACMNSAFYEAVARLPLGAAIAIEFLGPLGLAVILSHQIREYAWVALALAGVGTLAAAQGFTHHSGTYEPGASQLNLAGVAFALVAAVFWALYVLAGSRLARTGPPRGGLAASIAVAAVLVLPSGIASGGSDLVKPSVLAWGLLVAVLASAIPYSFEIRALKRLAKRTFSILTALEPAVGAIAGFFLLSQHLRPISFVGIALVVAAGIGATATARADDDVPVIFPESS